MPPSGVTNASAAFGGTSGRDIVVSYTLPTIDPADPNALISLKVKLIPTDQPTQSGFFYHTVVSGETNFTIPQNLIFAQFGNYFSSYSGSVYGVSQYGTESTSVANISTFTRANPLVGVIPVASVSNVIDGYTVNFNFSGTAATIAEVYQFFVDPTPLKNLNIDIQDYLDATFASGGLSGGNTLVLNNWLGDSGTTYDIPNVFVGGIITGNGVPSNTYVQSLSGSGSSRTVTLSKNLTSQASGNYHIQNLVYRGTTAANVFLNLYQTVYVLVVFYDDYDNNSSPSINYLATPTNPTTSVISNAVQIGSGGAIYVGVSKDTGSRIVLGPSGNKGPDGTSAYSGIFAFDYGATSGSSASTAIITNPSASSYTFETTNAKIADWVINSQYIQNTLGSSSNYVGLSASAPNGYSFWAGSSTSGGDASAKFSVTPQGKVSARDIVIYGSGNNSDTLLSAGAYFTVKGDGTVNASNATISGHLNVSQSSTFNSDITLGSNAYLVAGSLTGAGVIVSQAGITANNSSHIPTTQITASPMGTTSDGNSITFSTNAAYLGSTSGAGNPWIVTNGKIYSGVISLDSANQSITINTTLNGVSNPNSGVQLKWGASDSAAIKVGDLSSGGTPQFYVTHGGALYATNATVSGNVTANSFTIDANNYWNDSNHLGDFKAGNNTNYMWYTGGALTVTGQINATSGQIGSSTKYWTINSDNIKSNGTDAYIQLDALTDSVIAYSKATSALGTLVTYSATSSGGSIGTASNAAAAIATKTSLTSGKLSSDAYTIFTTSNAFQFFGTSATPGAAPIVSIDPTGSSTQWTNNGNVQAIGKSVFAANAGLIYLNSNDIIIGSSSSGYIYFNGSMRIRNDTPTGNSGANYLRNIWISPSNQVPSSGSTTGFVGDLWVGY